jgi:hypothetical protein
MPLITLEIIERPKKTGRVEHPHQTAATASRPRANPAPQPYGMKPLVTTKAIETDEKGWKHYAYLLRLTNTETGYTMDVPWRAGIANVDDPVAADVLESLLSSACGYENAEDIDDWANEFGYTSISEAVKTYRAEEEQAKQLRRLLGPGYHNAVFPPFPDDSETVSRRLTEEATTDASDESTD